MVFRDDNQPSTSTSSLSVSDEVSVLLECDLQQENANEINILPVRISCVRKLYVKFICNSFFQEGDLWRILAWKVAGSRLALALRVDITRLATLAFTFLNNEGPLIRLQSIILNVLLTSFSQLFIFFKYVLAVEFEGSPISLSESECLSVSKTIVEGSPRHKMKYVATLEKICETPKKSSLTSEPKLKVEDTELCVKKDEIRNEQSGCEKDDTSMKRSASKKSNLKLDLNNKSLPEQPQMAVAGCSKTNTHKRTGSKKLGQKSSSKSSLLDEPLTVSEKKGVSLPNLPTVNSPNVVVYSDSAVTRDNIVRTLKGVLDPDR